MAFKTKNNSICADTADAWPRKVNILHFNDVYNIEESEREPKAGAARFVTALRGHKNLNPATLFAGDALNPSMISTTTQGHHMVPILNAMNIDAAVMGNHDFDFGVENLEECIKKCNFPWLLSNITDLTTGESLAKGKVNTCGRTQWNSHWNCGGRGTGMD